MKIDTPKVNSRLHWTTLYSEKLLLAVIGFLTMFAAGMDVYNMVISLKVELGDLFLLFIRAEIISNGWCVHVSNRIVTLSIIIAMTALCRLIVPHPKEADPGCLLQKQVLLQYWQVRHMQ